MGSQNDGFWGKVGVLDFGFATPKRHFIAWNRAFDIFCVKIGARVSAVAFLKNPPPKQQPSHFVPRGAKPRMRRNETPKPIWIKFCMVVDIPDLVIHTNFGNHRLRGGQFSPFPIPIDFHRCPYNTLALPCVWWAWMMRPLVNARESCVCVFSWREVTRQTSQDASQVIAYGIFSAVLPRSVNCWGFYSLIGLMKANFIVLH